MQQISLMHARAPSSNLLLSTHLCLQPGGTGRVTALQVPGQQEEAEELEPAPNDVAKEACGCDSGSDGDEESGGGCQYAAWELPLLPGQNMFNVTLDLPANQSAADGADDSGSGDGSGGDGGSWEGRQASLAVVRLADPDHAELESLTGDLTASAAVARATPCVPCSAGSHGSARCQLCSAGSCMSARCQRGALRT